MGKFDYSIDIGKDLKKVEEAEEEKSRVIIQPVKEVPPVVLPTKSDDEEKSENFKVELQEVHGLNTHQVREVRVKSEVQHSSANVREESEIKVDPEEFRVGKLADPTHLEKDKFTEAEVLRRKAEEDEIKKPKSHHHDNPIPESVDITLNDLTEKLALTAKSKQDRYSQNTPSKTWHKILVLAIIILLAFTAWKYAYHPPTANNEQNTEKTEKTIEPQISPEQIEKNKEELKGVLIDGLK